MMTLLGSLLRILVRMPGFFAQQLGWRKEFDFLDILPQWMWVTVAMGKWRRRLHVIATAPLPEKCSFVFAGNHRQKDDPFIAFYAIWQATAGRIEIRHMMRDDFFANGPRIPFINLDEFLCMVGALQISRERPTLGQLKPFVHLLRNGLSFEMYPGRSRSRSGLLMEYRDGIDEPGSVSFFLAQAQRSHDELCVAATPFARTFNPATKHSTIIIGRPLSLSRDAGREEQRQLDHELIAEMGDLVEIQMPHAISLLLYLRCLHNRPAEIGRSELAARARSVLAELAARRYVDPRALEMPEREFASTLEFLKRHEIVSLDGELVRFSRDAILSTPPLDAAYRRVNPVKYLCNQVLHLPDVIDAFERAELR